MNEEMVIFTRTFDLLSWLLPATNNFPRAHRKTLMRRLLDGAFDPEERLGEANRRKDRARIKRWSGPTRRWTACACACAWPSALAGSAAGSTGTSRRWPQR